MVPQVVVVVVLIVGILHLGEAIVVLLYAGQVQVVVLKLATLRDGIWNHTLIDVALRLGVVSVKELAQVALAKVASVVDDDVEDDLHAAIVSSIDEVLEAAVVALVALVDTAEVHSVVAMVVKARAILHDGSNPAVKPRALM